MNFKIDNLQYCNWSRKIFEYNRSAGLDAVHVTIVYHEDYHELLDEIKKCIQNLSGTNFTILHCICVYPTPLDRSNLFNIHYLKQLHNDVGLSDHSSPMDTDLQISKQAIFQGISMLERHFRITDVEDTRDGKVSITPDMLCELKRFSKLPAGNRSLKKLFLSSCNSFSSSSPCASVSSCSLSTNRKAHSMPTSTDTSDILKSFKRHSFLAPQISFNSEFFSNSSELLNITIF